MAKTIIKSTGLDFNSIKNNLKIALNQTSEFSDYNFEGSGLSSLLDVLAYNTHYNGLIANYALNESFLSTAQLRSSVVGLAETVGYIPGSKKSSVAVVELKVTDATSPVEIVMPAGFGFSCLVENKAYTFKTREVLTASLSDAVGTVYTFKDTLGNTKIKLYEGSTRTKIFIAGNSSEEDTYVIQDSSLDLDSVTIRVYDTPSSSEYVTYTSIYNATSINSTSTIYVLKEAPNGNFELTFGNGTNLGRAPSPGSKIEVEYFSTSGPSANGGRVFLPSSTLNGLTVNVTTLAQSAGGLNKEGIESIRKNAPFLYAAQNRMVTAEDYAAIAQRNYSGYIQEVKAWGGEDNIPAKFGTVYLSIDFFDNVSNVEKNIVKEGIKTLAKDISVASFNVEYTDPTLTYIQTNVFFQWNPKLTSLQESQVETNVKNYLVSYFNANLGTFDKSFRRSKMLTGIDNVDPSILSSQAAILIHQRFVPDVSVIKDYVLEFPTQIKESLVGSGDIVTSTVFTYDGDECKIVNREGYSTLNIISNNTGKIVKENMGSYNTQTGVLTLVGFQPSSFQGDYIAITVVPSDESAISPQRSNILVFDSGRSTYRAVITNTL